MKLSYKYHTFNVPLSLLRLLKRRMRWVRAAGCIIEDDRTGNYLLIRRNGRWDLPKGKVEAGETLLQAATRESNEETSLDVSASSNQVPLKTYHIYNLYGGWHLKQTSWFKGHCGPDINGKPQQEEGITEVVWVTPDEWHRRLSTSYGTLRTLSKILKDKKQDL